MVDGPATPLDPFSPAQVSRAQDIPPLALGRSEVVTDYPRQPHGIQEPKLLLDVMIRNLEWFDRHVLGKGIAER